jgi:hypothetical protein
MNTQPASKEEGTNDEPALVPLPDVMKAAPEDDDGIERQREEKGALEDDGGNGADQGPPLAVLPDVMKKRGSENEAEKPADEEEDSQPDEDENDPQLPDVMSSGAEADETPKDDPEEEPDEPSLPDIRQGGLERDKSDDATAPLPDLMQGAAGTTLEEDVGEAPGTVPDVLKGPLGGAGS